MRTLSNRYSIHMDIKHTGMLEDESGADRLVRTVILCTVIDVPTVFEGVFPGTVEIGATFELAEVGSVCSWITSDSLVWPIGWTVYKE